MDLNDVVGIMESTLSSSSLFDNSFSTVRISILAPFLSAKYAASCFTSSIHLVLTSDFIVECALLCEEKKSSVGIESLKKLRVEVEMES